jgi:hypothetical protein
MEAKLDKLLTAGLDPIKLLSRPFWAPCSPSSRPSSQPSSRPSGHHKMLNRQRSGERGSLLQLQTTLEWAPPRLQLQLHLGLQLQLHLGRGSGRGSGEHRRLQLQVDVLHRRS